MSAKAPASESGRVPGPAPTPTAAPSPAPPPSPAASPGKGAGSLRSAMTISPAKAPRSALLAQQLVMCTCTGGHHNSLRSNTRKRRWARQCVACGKGQRGNLVVPVRARAAVEGSVGNVEEGLAVEVHGQVARHDLRRERSDGKKAQKRLSARRQRGARALGSCVVFRVVLRHGTLFYCPLARGGLGGLTA